MQRHILIVGGTSGIGLATANYLASKGNQISVAGRRSVSLDSFQSIEMDVRDEKSVRNSLRCLGESLSGFVYCAGTTLPKKSIDEFDIKSCENLFSVNVYGLLLCLKYFYPLVKKNKGKIVVVSSIAARSYSHFSGVEYTSSKYALSGIVRQLAVDFAKDGVQINSVFPSMTNTDLLRKNVDQVFLKKVEEGIPLKRIAQPIEVAKGIEFLLSENNSYMTGGSLDLNGGQFLNG